MQQNNLGARLSQAALAEPQCEALFEIFEGDLGTIQLGRLLKGNDAGRLVALRKLPEPPSVELASATDLARSIAHPRLAKVLGLIRDAENWFVASEYIAGVTLFELGRALEQRGTTIDPAVAIRVVLDALKASDEARGLLAHTANLHGVRCIYPESVWIAEFGEVFLSELLIAPLLDEASARTAPVSEADARSAEDGDVAAAVHELVRLLTGGTMLWDFQPEIPDELNDLLVEGIGLEGARGFPGTMQELIEALSSLGDLVASEDQVSAELRRLMGLVLERRQQKLEMLERFSPQPKEDDATRFFRVAVTPEQSDTTRPPPAALSVSPVSGEAPSTKKPAPREHDPSDDLTSMYKSKAPSKQPDPAATVPPPQPFVPVPPVPSTVREKRAAESEDNSISAVWRQARDLLESPARSAKQRVLQIPIDAKRSSVSNEFIEPVAPLELAVEPKPTLARGKLILLLVLGLALAAALALRSPAAGHGSTSARAASLLSSLSHLWR